MNRRQDVGVKGESKVAPRFGLSDWKHGGAFYQKGKTAGRMLDGAGGVILSSHGGG